MTQQIGTHGLSCPTDTDYAAIALSMQCNALATDEALTSQGSSLEDYLGRPWWQAVNTIAITIDDAAGGGSVGPFGVVGGVIGSGAPLVTAFNMPADFSGPFPQGVFLIGSTIAWSLVTPTANSYRQLSVFGVRRIAGDVNIVTTFTDLYAMRDMQGDAGNTGALNVFGFLDNTAGDVVQVNAFFSHANTASDLTVAANGWRLWAMYLGSGLNI